jgi:hypothetical protein
MSAVHPEPWLRALITNNNNNWNPLGSNKSERELFASTVVFAAKIDEHFMCLNITYNCKHMFILQYTILTMILKVTYLYISLDWHSGLQEVEIFRFYTPSTYGGGKDFSPTHRSSLTQKTYLVFTIY